MLPANGSLSKLLVTASLLTLIGCTSTPTHHGPSVIAQPTLVYPDLPPIEYPPGPDLQPIHFDFPRNADAKPVLKSTPECLETPIAKRDLDFWVRCGQQPFTPKSNVFIGLQYDQWLILQQNFVALEEYIKAARARLDLVNQQREEWRQKNRRASPTSSNPPFPFTDPSVGPK